MLRSQATTTCERLSWTNTDVQPALESYESFLASSEDKYPDEEFKARQRVRIIKREMTKR